MGRDQLIFSKLFEGAHYGPRNGFEYRDWQSELGDDYTENVLRFRDSRGDQEQHKYIVVGGTGCGKTKAAAGLVAWMLNSRLIDQVVFVCPNRAIRRKTQKDFKHFFGIDLRVFNKRKHEDGIPREVQGYILTYSHLLSDPTLHRRICLRTPTLVVFDEIHHLGDEGAWGSSAEEAFGKVPFVIGLSGTPYRSDNRCIPFVKYQAKADDSGILCFSAEPPYGYTYNLGRAVDDGVCREPLFVFHDGTVKVRIGVNMGHSEVTFDDIDLSPEMSALRLRGAVKYGSSCRLEMLSQALQRCKEEGRKVVIFLGGDTEGDQTPTEDAKELLPKDLTSLRIGPNEYEIITGDDAEAQAKIESFGVSDKWILVSINMVSEGVDIPELSAAIFLTSITAKQTTVQRIGRVLRYMGSLDRHPDALIFMFADPEYKILVEEIKSVIDHEINLGRKRRNEPGDATGGISPPDQRRPEAIGVDGGNIVMVKIGTNEVSNPVMEEAKRKLRAMGLPVTMLNAYLLVTAKG